MRERGKCVRESKGEIGECERERGKCMRESKGERGKCGRV